MNRNIKIIEGCIICVLCVALIIMTNLYLKERKKYNLNHVSTESNIKDKNDIVTSDQKNEEEIQLENEETEINESTEAEDIEEVPTNTIKKLNENSTLKASTLGVVDIVLNQDNSYKFIVVSLVENENEYYEIDIDLNKTNVDGYFFDIVRVTGAGEMKNCGTEELSGLMEYYKNVINDNGMLYNIKFEWNPEDENELSNAYTYYDDTNEYHSILMNKIQNYKNLNG